MDGTALPFPRPATLAPYLPRLPPTRPAACCCWLRWYVRSAEESALAAATYVFMLREMKGILGAFQRNRQTRGPALINSGGGAGA